MCKCNIACEHPVIIENPYLKQLVTKFQIVHLKDKWLNLRISHTCVDEGHGSFRWTGSAKRNPEVWSEWYGKYSPMFWKSRTQVTLDDMDDFYVLDPSTGETFPIYMAVPCNKCPLCRERKARQWQTRCLCETAESEYPPLFITLTYRDSDLPSDGVSKKDVQKFMKRLRIRLERHFDKKFYLRYVLVSEYGKNTHRAHYHMLLWNMPFISSEGVNSWQALHDYIQDAWSHGWIGLEKCVDCSGKYCMKYLRKECVVPEGQNPVFLLSSRRGGIGRKFADRLTEHARSNPDISCINVLNPFDGTTTRCSIPDYFKRIWFPSLSGIVKQEIRDDVSNFLEKARCAAYCLTYLPNAWYLDPLLDMFNEVSEKYRYCTEDFYDTLPERINRKDLDVKIHEYERDWLHYVGSERFYDDDWFTSLWTEIKASYVRLKNYDVDRDRVEHLLWLHANHSDIMKRLAELCDPINVQDELARIERESIRLERGVRPDECLHDLENSLQD